MTQTILQYSRYGLIKVKYSDRRTSTDGSCFMCFISPTFLLTFFFIVSMWSVQVKFSLIITPRNSLEVTEFILKLSITISGI